MSPVDMGFFMTPALRHSRSLGLVGVRDYRTIGQNARSFLGCGASPTETPVLHWRLGWRPLASKRLFSNALFLVFNTLAESSEIGGLKIPTSPHRPFPLEETDGPVAFFFVARHRVAICLIQNREYFVGRAVNPSSNYTTTD